MDIEPPLLRHIPPFSIFSYCYGCFCTLTIQQQSTVAFGSKLTFVFLTIHPPKKKMNKQHKIHLKLGKLLSRCLEQYENTCLQIYTHPPMNEQTTYKTINTRGTMLAKIQTAATFLKRVTRETMKQLNKNKT